MEVVEQYNTLVYPHSTAVSREGEAHAATASTSWNQSTPNSSSSSLQLSPIYSAVSRSGDHSDFPSPASSTSYPSLRHNQYLGYPQSPTVRPDDSDRPMPMGLGPQIPGSIGPNRNTRRQTRAQSALYHELRRDRPTVHPTAQRTSIGEDDSIYYMSPASAVSRPQTPINSNESPRYQSQSDRGMHYTMTSSAMSLPSPRYPPTPVSASPYSTFGLHHTHSRSNSTCNSVSNPRSTSPTLSIASALTSISSSASIPNSQTFAAYPLPSPPGLPIGQRAKQRKQRLFNVDRKAICIYHQQNPNARQEDIAARYGVERSTISKILKNKTKWLNVPEDDEMRVAKHRPSKFPEVEEAMGSWLEEIKEQNVSLSDNMIRTKAKETARRLQIPDDRFKASSGWVENFKHRNNIRKGVWLGASKIGRIGRGAVHDLRNSNESALSPLNPAFEPRTEFLDDRESVALSNTADDMEDDMESEDSPDPEINEREEPQNRPSLSLQPAWPVEVDTAGSADTSLSPDHSSTQHSSASQQHLSVSQQHHSVVQQHQSVPPHHHQSTSQQSYVPLASHHNHHHHHNHLNSTESEMPRDLQAPPISQQLTATVQPQHDAHSQTHEASPIQYPETVIVYQTAPPITAGSTIPDIAEAEDAINKVILFVDSQSTSLLTHSEREALTSIKYALFQAGSGVPYNRDGR